jgi:hypothetical protein
MAMVPNKLRNRKKSTLSKEDKRLVRAKKQLANKRRMISKRQKSKRTARGQR